jgi:hypothetical protein
LRDRALCAKVTPLRMAAWRRRDISFIWMKLGCGNGPLDRTLVGLIIFWCQLATFFNRLLQIDRVKWQIENILAFLQLYK